MHIRPATEADFDSWAELRVALWTSTLQMDRPVEWMPGRARHGGYGVTVSEAHMGFGKADRPPRTFARSQAGRTPRARRLRAKTKTGAAAPPPGD